MPGVTMYNFSALSSTPALPADTQRERGVLRHAALTSVIRSRAPSDPLTTIKLTISGIRPGSEVQIFGPGRVVLAGKEGAGTSETFTLPLYAQGNPNNNIRVFVLGLGYEVVDFDYQLLPGGATIPIFQRIDRSYRNPA